MTRSIGAGLLADITQPAAERCQLITMDFADTSNVSTPVYLATAAQDISWDGKSWEAIGGLEIDALGESADGAANGVRLKLSGVDQAILALIHGGRWRGRTARIYHAGFSQATGLVLADPIEFYSGPMTGGFQIGESRGEFGGGKVDITTRLTSWLDELVKHRGVHTNKESHQAVIPGATTDTFFQNVPALTGRRSFWGVREPPTGQPAINPPAGPITQTQPGPSPSSPSGGPPPGSIPPPSSPTSGGGTNSNPWGLS